MTVAIKGMDMPKNAKTCRFRHSIFNYCVIDKNRDTIKTDKFDKCLNCPLIDLPEDKDMSWEELVEKVKQLKSALLTVNEDYISYSAFEGCTHILEFGIDNQIVFRYADEEKIIHTDKSFYGMWVIIKALIGDER